MAARGMDVDPVKQPPDPRGDPRADLRPEPKLDPGNVAQRSIPPEPADRARARGTAVDAVIAGAAAAAVAAEPPQPGTTSLSGAWPASADAELAELCRRARWLGGQGRDPVMSFTSLFLAFLGGGTPIAEWVKASAEELELALPSILTRWAQSRTTYPPGIKPEHVRAPQAPDRPGSDQTPSVRAVLETAQSYQKQLRSPALGARHVMAAYLFASLGHDPDFEAWGLRQRIWAVRFVVFLGHAFPDEARGWRALCARRARAVRSGRVDEVLSAAAALADARGGSAVEVDDLVRALLHCARQSDGDPDVAHAWLLDKLGQPALDTLEVPAQIAGHDPAAPRLHWIDSSTAVADVDDWLDTARIWSLTCPRDELHLRHLVAALLSPRGPTSGKRMLRRAGGAPTRLATAYAGHIQTIRPNEDHATWQWLLDNDQPPREIRKPGYANDVARGVDVLEIGSDVRALAAVLASTETQPPLSVGLFGSWGSGKSFFMAMLRDHIRALAQHSTTAPHTAYCAQIAQIEFNAWHYIDGDLWASLVSHVLDSLEGYFRGDQKSLVEQRRVELATTQLKRAELEKQQRGLDARRQRLEAAVSSYSPSGGEIAGAAGREVERTVKDRTAEAHSEVRKALDVVAQRIGVPPGELSLSKAREHANAFRAWWKQLSWKSLLIGLIFLTIAAIGALAAAYYQRAALALLAALSPAVVVIERVIQIGRPIAKVAREASAIGERVTKQLAHARPEIFHEQQDLEAEQAALAAEQQRLDRRAEELRALLDAAKAPGMREYVLERASHYRDKLGIVATVHRDFQNLSDQLRDDTTEPKLQRIILYIDDLDRCPPERVVEMLQAIHLLLSFELFVVVVAVDPKWLLRSLEAYYARQFQLSMSAIAADDRESRPQFYLEKIFQIPYALQPMSPARFELMVRSLLKTAVAAGDGEGAGAADDAAASSISQIDEASAAPLVDAPAGDAASDAARLDLMPRSLEISNAELAHLRTLGPLVSSPRAAKRLTNLYRIVRAGLCGDELEEFIDDGFQLTQIALAAVVGCPDVAVVWLKDVLVKSTGDLAALIAPLEAMAAKNPRARFLRDRIRDCPECASWDHVIEVCSRAARYSFETGGLLELLPATLPPA